jgi:hypothetical protein
METVAILFKIFMGALFILGIGLAVAAAISKSENKEAE